jgi:hypothetical protein
MSGLVLYGMYHHHFVAVGGRSLFSNPITQSALLGTLSLIFSYFFKIVFLCGYKKPFFKQKPTSQNCHN